MERPCGNLSTSYWSPPGPPHRGFHPRNAALRFSQLGAGFARLPQLLGLHGPEISGRNYPDTGGYRRLAFFLFEPLSIVRLRYNHT